MRRAGRISDWNDDKGYGFVVPHDGGDRAFVHVKALQSGSRRPIEGDLISYSITKDDRGRMNAVDVRFAGHRIVRRQPSRPVPRNLLGVLFLLAVGLWTLVGLVPAGVAVAYVMLSGLSYYKYAMDKAAAGGDKQRTPEGTLHFVDLLGGWPGALLAQHRFRHKTAKASFQKVFWMTVVFNLATIGWLVHSGIAGSLTRVLLGS